MFTELPGAFVDPACPLDWSHPLNVGLVAEWAVLPNSGWQGGATVHDLSLRRSRHDLTVGGGSFSWTTPIQGGYGSFSLGSTASYLNNPSSTAESLPNDFTWLGWFNLTATSTAILFSHGSSWRVAAWVGVLRFTLPGVADYSFSSTLTLTAGTTYFAAITRSGTSLVGYVGGSGGLASEGQTISSATASGSMYRIGDPDFTSFSALGRLDRFAVFRRAWPSGRVAAFYDESRRGNPTRWRWAGRRTWFPPDQAVSPPPPPPPATVPMLTLLGVG